MLTFNHSRVFPQNDWQTYAWDPADPSITYESFIEGVEGKNRPNFEATDNLMFWHFPTRGTDPGLDKLLNCLVCLQDFLQTTLPNLKTRSLEPRMRLRKATCTSSISPSLALIMDL